MYSDKYAPTETKNIIGQNQAVEQTLLWLSKWKKGKALLFFGPPGSGKTSLAKALALEKKMDIIEVNASDYRNKDDIEKTIGEASKQASLFGRRKLILIDEVDGVAGREDRGGVAAVIEVIKSSPFPVILTANDAYDEKLRSLRNYCELVKFSKVHMGSMGSLLKSVSKAENLPLDEEKIKSIAREAGGDLRAAFNDLEALSSGFDREHRQNVFECLKVLFKTSSIKTARDMLADCELSMEDFFWWVENNLPSEYEKPEELAKALDMLSRADVFRGRVMRRQNWKLMAYYSDLISSVSTAKKEMYRKFVPYRPPSRFALYARRQKNGEAMKKLASAFHTSTSTVKSQYMDIVRNLGETDLRSLGLTKEEVETLSKS